MMISQVCFILVIIYKTIYMEFHNSKATARILDELYSYSV